MRRTTAKTVFAALNRGTEAHSQACRHVLEPAVSRAVTVPGRPGAATAHMDFLRLGLMTGFVNPRGGDS